SRDWSSDVCSSDLTCSIEDGFEESRSIEIRSDDGVTADSHAFEDELGFISADVERGEPLPGQAFGIAWHDKEADALFTYAPLGARRYDDAIGAHAIEHIPLYAVEDELLSPLLEVKIGR